MILLVQSKYNKVIEPLKEVSINNFFARSVAEQHVSGSIYADNAEDPKTFYILHPYGMSLLIGKTDNEEFNSGLLDYCLNKHKTRDKLNWLQVFPDSWNDKLSTLLGDSVLKISSKSDILNNGKVEQYTRVNFKFDKDKYSDFKQRDITKNYKIIRTDKVLFDSLEGSVIPKYFWDNADDFVNHGVGFTLIYKDRSASTAYSAFVHDNFLELGIETSENHRGKGFALYTCSALIDYCLENNYEPVWACRSDHTGSFNLAQKLGFKPTDFIPYYKLPI